MRYINSRFTYLLTYSISRTYLGYIATRLVWEKPQRLCINWKRFGKVYADQSKSNKRLSKARIRPTATVGSESRMYTKDLEKNGVDPPFRRVRHFQPFPAVTTY